MAAREPDGRVCAATVAAVAGASYWVVSLGPAPLGEGLAFSTLVVDRNGNLLRPYTTLEGRWRLPATRENVDPRFLAMLLAYEDRRFTRIMASIRSRSAAPSRSCSATAASSPARPRYDAGGAPARAARRAQLAAKLRQMVRAIAIERSLSKDEILALYLSLAPTAAISKARARQRSPISARSRAA